jgi:hypothetical protein
LYEQVTSCFFFLIVQFNLPCPFHYHRMLKVFVFTLFSNCCCYIFIIIQYSQPHQAQIDFVQLHRLPLSFSFSFSFFFSGFLSFFSHYIYYFYDKIQHININMLLVFAGSINIWFNQYLCGEEDNWNKDMKNFRESFLAKHSELDF